MNLKSAMSGYDKCELLNSLKEESTNHEQHETRQNSVVNATEV